MPMPSTTGLKPDYEVKKRISSTYRCASGVAPSAHSTAIERKEYLERKERREQFSKDALVAWDHYQTTGQHATAEDADAWLAKLQAGKKVAPPKCRA